KVRHAGPVPRVEVALTGKFSTRRPGPAGRLDSAGAQAQPGVRCQHVVDRDGRQSWREPVVTTQLIGVCAGPGVGDVGRARDPEGLVAGEDHAAAVAGQGAQVHGEGVLDGPGAGHVDHGADVGDGAAGEPGARPALAGLLPDHGVGGAGDVLRGVGAGADQVGGEPVRVLVVDRDEGGVDPVFGDPGHRAELLAAGEGGAGVVGTGAVRGGDDDGRAVELTVESGGALEDPAVDRHLVCGAA